MFAARFDPTKSESNNSSKLETKTTPSVLPQKRTKASDEGSSSEEEVDEEDDEQKNDEEVKKSFNSGEHFSKELYPNVSSSEESDSQSSDDEFTQSSDNQSKHSSLLRRFQQTLLLQADLKSDGSVSTQPSNVDSRVVHNLSPIPQPKKVKDTPLKPTDSIYHKTIAWNSVTKIYYDNTMIKDFDEYENVLDGKLLDNIKKTFSLKTFPIQTSIFDSILPRLTFASTINKTRFTRQVGDILVNASTGSGKTLAYSVPIIQCLKTRVVNRLRALIIVPTKILIYQVYECLSKLNEGSSLHIAMSKLDNSMKEEHTKFLQNCPDILIITPGRLVDHLQLESFSLKSLKFLVLDEADRLLNQSFQNWNYTLLSRIKTDKSDDLPGNLIKMVFSATLTTNTEKLHSLQLHNPKVFIRENVKLFSMPKKLQEYNVPIPTSKSVLKPFVLLKILAELTCSDKSDRLLIFVKSNEASIRLAALLKIMMAKNIIPGLTFNVSSINSNNNKGENKRLIQEFSENNDIKSVLVSTDVMSRGIDINDISHVINYDLPISSRQYVHRCGRTARANMSGVALNMLVGKGERIFWADHINVDLSRDNDGHEPELYKEENDLQALYSVDETLNSLYMSCLEELKQVVMVR